MTAYLFLAGQTVATPGALAAIEEAGQSPLDFIDRHLRGDWGNVPQEDAELNTLALDPADPARILSSYKTHKGARLWVITEWDRSVTTVLLPEEY